jgi:hypothetical protein
MPGFFLAIPRSLAWNGIDAHLVLNKGIACPPAPLNNKRFP